ncbi:MAG: N-acetyltransferase [Acidimicrobiales bacterium]
MTGGGDGESDGGRGPIVADGFVPPTELATEHTVLRPLGPEHNESDHRGWSSSIDHIRSTPGFGPAHNWPPTEGMVPEQNLADLEAHRRDFEANIGFTYTVLDRAALPAETVLGCVYIYGDPTGVHDVEVRSWVVGTRPELDRELWSAVSAWLASDWPFASVRYASRDR